MVHTLPRRGDRSLANIRLSEIACFSTRVASPDGPYTLSHGRRYEGFGTTIVKVTADDGSCGFGEASTMGSDYLDGFLGSTQAALRKLAPVVLGCDPLQGRAVVLAMDTAVLGHHPAKAAIDIALWDLRGRLLGVPVGALLGGITQLSLDAFSAVRVGSREAMAAEAQMLSDRGYTRLQIKVGDDPVEDAARVRAVVDVLGKNLHYLACDANCGWTAAQALRFVRALGDMDTYLEQPCATISELARLRGRCGNPIIIDEAAKQASDLLDALALGCVDGVNIKPVRVGGLTKAASMRDIAEAAGLMILVDEPMGGRLASAGVAQLASTVDPAKLVAVSFFGDNDYAATSIDRVASGGPEFSEGRVSVPLGPGLSVVIDEEALGDPVFVFRRTDLVGT